MKNWVKIICMATLALSLGACSKKSNKSSTVATTPTAPTQQCLYNPTYGRYMLEGTTTECTNPTQTGQCTYNSLYQQYMIVGTTTPCTPTTGTGQCVQGQYGLVDQYGNPCSSGSLNGCDVYNTNPSQAYYIPMHIHGQLKCVNYYWLQQFGYQYYGQTGSACNWGNNYCSGGYSYQGSTCVNIGGQSWGQNYGLNGSIGFCW